MISYVLGPAGCGKSAFAESLCEDGNYKRKYYIATMKVVDEASGSRRDKHRSMREGKGFETLEIPYYIDEAPQLMADPGNCVVLLECVANLVGNAMHESEWDGRLRGTEGEVADDFCGSIIESITLLAAQVGHLIVVSEEYGEDELSGCDDETRVYAGLLHAVNARLARIADKVYKR